MSSSDRAKPSRTAVLKPGKFDGELKFATGRTNQSVEPPKQTRKVGFNLRAHRSGRSPTNRRNDEPYQEVIKSTETTIQRRRIPRDSTEYESPQQEKGTTKAYTKEQENKDHSEPNHREADLWDWYERRGFKNFDVSPPDQEVMESDVTKVMSPSSIPRESAPRNIDDNPRTLYDEVPIIDSCPIGLTLNMLDNSDRSVLTSGDYSRITGANRHPAKREVEKVTGKIHRIRRKLNFRGNKARWRYRIDEHKDDDTKISDREGELPRVLEDDESMWEWNDDDQSIGSVRRGGFASDLDDSFENSSTTNTLRSRGRSRPASTTYTDARVSFDSTVSEVSTVGVNVPPTEGVAIRNRSDGREFRVKPYHTFLPKVVYMTEKEIYGDMMKPSEKVEFLQSCIVPSHVPPSERHVTHAEQQMWGNSDDGRIGSIRVEVLACLGLTKHKPDVCVYLVCGDCAFATDVLHRSRSPMWPSKSKRAAVFPIHHAFVELFAGVFDVLPKRIGDNDDFCGRVVLDISPLRPNSEYDVTLPLRASSFIYDRQPRGVIRLRFSLHWFSERAAVVSYFQTAQVTTAASPGADSPSILCADPKTFRNIAFTVHGKDLPGKYSRKAFQATMREFNLYQSNIRLTIASLIKDTICYNKPFLSVYIFASWMHCVIVNSVRLVPVYFVGLLIFLMVENYAWYIRNESSHLGYAPPTLSEIIWALVDESNSGQIAPLLTKKKARDVPFTLETRKRLLQITESRTVDDEPNHREFPYSDKTLYPKIAVEDALVKRHKAGHQMQMVGRLSIYVKSGSFEDDESSVVVNASTQDLEEDEEDDDSIFQDHDDTDYVLDLDTNDEDHRSQESETVATNCTASSVKRQSFLGPPQDADVRPKKKIPPQVHLARVEDQLNKLTKSIFMDRIYAASLPLRTHSNIVLHEGESIDKLSLPKSTSLAEEAIRKLRIPLDEFDRRLGLRVRPANPVVGITSTFLGPLMRIFRVFCNIFRAGFNVATWKDPFLSFWALCLLILLLLILLIFPWRLFCGVIGFVLFGPQNVFMNSRLEKMITKTDEALAAVDKRAERHKNGTEGEIPSSITINGNDDVGFVKPEKRRRLQQRIGAIVHSRITKRNNKAGGNSDPSPGSMVDVRGSEALAQPKSPFFDRPAFTTPNNASSNKKNLTPREVLVPYSRFRKERFYDFPPDPTVSRCSAITFDNDSMSSLYSFGQ